MIRHTFVSSIRAVAALAVAASLLIAPAVQSADALSTFHQKKLEEIDAAVSLAIADGRCPGGVLWIEHRGQNYSKAYGDRSLEPVKEVMSADTIFDLASLTKVIATTTAIMKLVEQGEISLEAPVQQYIPEFIGKEGVSVKHLMTHTSGLRPGLSLAQPWTGPEAALKLACAEKLTAPPGTTLRYSDINYIVLGELVRIVSGKRLDEFCAEQIFRPLGMKDTGFLPAENLKERVAPTQRTADGILRAVVHDPTARRIGGVAGHAGLFGTTADLARFSRMLLNGGELEGVRILKPETVRLMTSVQTGEGIPRRGLGWDIDSPYAGPRGNWFPVGSYGHTGWTGGSLWIDPFSQSFVVFLSNRNHPTESGNVLPLRRLLGTLSAEAIRDFNFAWVPDALPRGSSPQLGAAETAKAQGKAEVLSGIDVLVRDEFAPLKGKRVGLITNHTGIDRQRRSTIDLLFKAPDVKLVALFSPEHGIRGVMDEKVGDSKDEKTGLPIFSLYGDRRSPLPEQLAQCDVLIFDIQDIGCRFYTYISTLGECMTAAAKQNVKFMVLDRPNPIGGAVVQGPILNAERSFVAWHEIPLRHGMTVGELAKMFNEERKLGADLTVVPCEGWARSQWFDATDLPWINPSPNMRGLNAAALYPGVGVLEFCNLSVGRGTDRPFEYLGAPYIDDRRLARELNDAGLDGVRCIPVRFTPNASVHANKECGGVQFIVTNRDTMNPVDLGITIATVLQRLYPADLKFERIAKLLADPVTQKAIAEGQSLSAIQTAWVPGREEFRTRREKFLIYR
jgi:uncharacterized protein YbbC (DUF1343 family)/CubicO group peptidase (beta-lactamase class C family)